MKVRINGKDETIDKVINIAQLVSERGLIPGRVVVEHNLKVVPKEAWGKITVREGDSIEIVSFMGGGSASQDILTIGGKPIKNRLFIGTGKFSGYPVMRRVLEEADVDVVTVALRRVDSASKTENILDHIPKRAIIVPNTSGARNAEEAVRIACLARASGCGNWVKIEVIQDNKYLLPDNMETLRATEILAREGFVVLPYMSPDLSMARRLVNAGASAVMPLGSPIGSNRGIRTRELVEILVSEIGIPVIVDAGLGKPSDACLCMEMGCAAVLVNTAIAIAEDPIGMAKAFDSAVRAGRLAYLSGIPTETKRANASSPLTGFLRKDMAD